MQFICSRLSRFNYCNAIYVPDPILTVAKKIYGKSNRYHIVLICAVKRARQYIDVFQVRCVKYTTVLFEYLSCCYQSHNLVCSGVYLNKFCISHHSFNRVIFHVTITPKDLDSICCDLHCIVRGHEFCYGT